MVDYISKKIGMFGEDLQIYRIREQAAIITWCKPKEKAELQELPLSLLLRFDLAKHWVTSTPIEINGSWMSSEKK